MKLKATAGKILVTAFVPVALYLLFFFLKPASFGKAETMYNIFQQSIISCILAWGLSFTMMMNQFDLAVGAEIILAAIFGALLAPMLGIPGIIIGGIAGGILTGSIKVLAFKYLKIPTMILTIALTYVFAALGGIITKSASLVIAPQYSILSDAPWNIIVFLFAGFLIYILHRFSPYGAQVRAVSNSEKLSQINGINVNRVRVIALFISSLFAGIAAILKLSHGSSVAPSDGLSSISTILEPIMSVFIGIVMMRFVNISIGIFVGSLLMSIISNGLIAISMPPSYNNVVVGCVLIFLMVFINVKILYDKKILHRNIARMRCSQ